jgi:hypothetical protein
MFDNDPFPSVTNFQLQIWLFRSGILAFYVRFQLLWECVFISTFICWDSVVLYTIIDEEVVLLDGILKIQLSSWCIDTLKHWAFLSTTADVNVWCVDLLSNFSLLEVLAVMDASLDSYVVVGVALLGDFISSYNIAHFVI